MVKPVCTPVYVFKTQRFSLRGCIRVRYIRVTLYKRIRYIRTSNGHALQDRHKSKRTDWRYVHSLRHQLYVYVYTREPHPPQSIDNDQHFGGGHLVTTNPLPLLYSHTLRLKCPQDHTTTEQ